MPSAFHPAGSPSCRLAAIALAAALTIGGARPPSGQSGYALEQHLSLGISFPLARSYAQIPTQPGERWLVLSYAEELAKDPAARKAVRPLMSILSIEREAGPAPAADTGGDGDGERLARPEDPARPIDSVERWVEQRMPTWTLERTQERKPRDGYAIREHALAQRGATEPRLGGWICAYQNEQRTIAIVGLCAAIELEEQIKLWRTSAEKLRFSEPEADDAESLARYYARLELSDTEHRIAVRLKLARGWKAEDTEHYIIVYDTPDQPLIRKIAYDIELLRGEYRKYFPSVGNPEPVSTVRVCKNRDEYLAYGGTAESAGYWNAASEELVLYDARKPQKNQPDDDRDTFLVLYHEAFHQYIHYSTGELAPHPWYNEGHGDFFSGAEIHGRLKSIGINPWRIELARNLVANGEYVPWNKLVRYELRPFMDDGFRCYAQSWSMIHFLRFAPEVAKRPEWAKILPTYFETLKSAFAEELAALGSERSDPLLYWKAGYLARSRAVDAAFAGVDFEEIEKAWAVYVGRLEIPKR